MISRTAVSRASPRRCFSRQTDGFRRCASVAILTASYSGVPAGEHTPSTGPGLSVDNLTEFWFGRGQLDLLRPNVAVQVRPESAATATRMTACARWQPEVMSCFRKRVCRHDAEVICGLRRGFVHPGHRYKYYLNCFGSASMVFGVIFAPPPTTMAAFKFRRAPAAVVAIIRSSRNEGTKGIRPPETFPLFRV